MKMRTMDVIHKTKTVFLYCVCAAAASSHAQTQDNPSVFVARQFGSVGWVNIATPEGGQYVYGEEPAARPKGAVFTLGKTERVDYDFFSYQEEEALWLVREGQLRAFEAQDLRERMAQRKRSQKNHQINWPKVVVSGKRVCVPVLESAGASDWQDHLTCTEVPEHE